MRLILFFYFCLTVLLNAATVRQLRVQSPSMKREVPVSIVLPESYQRGEARYPVIYLLHGAGGNNRTSTLSPFRTLSLADLHNVIVVCPDGGSTSWWLDSPIDPSMKYETFVTKELLPYVDGHYRTLPERGKRGITGGSMGGHGACYLGIRHRDLFGVIGNVHGGVDLLPFPDSWEIKKRLGPLKENPQRWRDHSVITLAKGVRNGEIDLITVIGTQDFFLQVNRDLHQLLARQGVAHTYIEICGRDRLHSSHTGYFAAEAYPVIFRYMINAFKEGRGHL